MGTSTNDVSCLAVQQLDMVDSLISSNDSQETDHVREVNHIMISTRLTNPIHGAVRELVTHDEHSVVDLHHLFTFPLVDSTAPWLMVLFAPLSSLIVVLATKHQRGAGETTRHSSARCFSRLSIVTRPGRLDQSRRNCFSLPSLARTVSICRGSEA